MTTPVIPNPPPPPPWPPTKPGFWVRSSVCVQGECVEVSLGGGDVLVRDSKRPDGPVLRYPKQAWLRFVGLVLEGKLPYSAWQRDDGGMDLIRPVPGTPVDVTLTFTREEWDAFVEGVEKGEFDLRRLSSPEVEGGDRPPSAPSSAATDSPAGRTRSAGDAPACANDLAAGQPGTDLPTSLGSDVDVDGGSESRGLSGPAGRVPLSSPEGERSLQPGQPAASSSGGDGSVSRPPVMAVGAGPRTPGPVPAAVVPRVWALAAPPPRDVRKVRDADGDDWDRVVYHDLAPAEDDWGHEGAFTLSWSQLLVEYGPLTEVFEVSPTPWSGEEAAAVPPSSAAAGDEGEVASELQVGVPAGATEPAGSWDYESCDDTCRCRGVS